VSTFRTSGAFRRRLSTWKAHQRCRSRDERDAEPGADERHDREESTQVLHDAGATLVASTLAETRTYLGGLGEIPRIPLPEASSVQAA